MTTSNIIDFDFDAAIAEKNKFASKPKKQRLESPVDLATAKMLGLVEEEISQQDVRLLIALEDTDYRAYLSGLISSQMAPEYGVSAPMSRSDTQLLNAASAWNQQLQAVAIFSCYSQVAYSEICPLGVLLMGSGVANEEALLDRSAGWGKTPNQKTLENKMLRLAADFCPTHIVMRTPNRLLLNWANRNRINSVVLLDSWQEPLECQHQHNTLIKQLNHSNVRWVGSRGISACKMVEGSGVAADKLIPWEWPNAYPFEQHYPPKELNSDRAFTKLLYVGSLSKISRVGDLLSALSFFKQREHPTTLRIIIDDSTSESALDWLRQRSQALNVTESVLLSLANSSEQLLALVRAADAVVIPGYTPRQDAGAEPPLIVQAARAACTPIVACDRAYLKDYLTHGVNAMIFPEGNEKAMAHRIERLMGQPQLYAQLSEAGNIAQRQLMVPATWKALIERWIGDRPVDRQWLRNYAFSSDRYRPLEVSVA